jgi:putative Holliday junction resolvase
VADFLGIDLGGTHVGLAVAERESGLAHARPPLRRTSDAALVEAIAGICRDEGVGAIVLGHPLTLAGGVSAQTKWVRQFAENLQARTGLPVHLVDERLTSVAARRTSPGEREHSEAARLILELFLSRP